MTRMFAHITSRRVRGGILTLVMIGSVAAGAAWHGHTAHAAGAQKHGPAARASGRTDWCPVSDGCQQ
jgi:hypothetical protein